MRTLRIAALTALAGVILAAFTLACPAFHPYDAQFRDHADEAPSRAFPLGTDDLGRDRLSRLAYATRVSVALGCAAAAISTALGIAAALGSVSVLRGPLDAFTTLCLSLPWMFVFVIVRGLLPLNTSPGASMALTFGVMGLAGWAAPARVFDAFFSECRRSEWLMTARAGGIPEWRIWLKQYWPRVRSIAWAQFRALVPAYILAEAGLGLLGLGVAEPATSLGNLIAELERAGATDGRPWVLAPIATLAVIAVSTELLRDRRGRAPL